MKKLIEKLETLADEAIALVMEERARRNFQLNPLYGPRGTELVRPQPWPLESPPLPQYPELKWGGNGVMDSPRVT